MTRIALAAFFILLQQFAFAQRGAGKYWVAEKPRYAERSFSTLLIEKVERTPQFTVVTMSFTNKNKDETLISICNSFKLMSGGKKVASIVSTQNIPMYDVIKNGFRCAELPDAKLVRGSFTSNAAMLGDAALLVIGTAMRKGGAPAMREGRVTIMVVADRSPQFSGGGQVNVT